MAKRRRTARTVLSVLGLLFVSCATLCARPWYPSFGGLPVEVTATKPLERVEPRARKLQLEGGELSLRASFDLQESMGDVVAVSAHRTGPFVVEIRVERVLSTMIPLDCINVTRYEVVVGDLPAGDYHVVVTQGGNERMAGDTSVRGAANVLAMGGARSLHRAPPC